MDVLKINDDDDNDDDTTVPANTVQSCNCQFSSHPVAVTYTLSFGIWCWEIALYIVRDMSFFNTIFVSSHMYPKNPEETQVIIGSMNMGMI